mgnify:CR=1 FL=1
MLMLPHVCRLRVCKVENRPKAVNFCRRFVDFALSSLQVFAAAVGDEFKFLDDMDYMYESEGEVKAPGPWNSFHNIATEDQEDEQEPRYRDSQGIGEPRFGIAKVLNN